MTSDIITFDLTTSFYHYSFFKPSLCSLPLIVGRLIIISFTHSIMSADAPILIIRGNRYVMNKHLKLPKTKATEGCYLSAAEVS